MPFVTGVGVSYVITEEEVRILTCGNLTAICTALHKGCYGIAEYLSEERLTTRQFRTLEVTVSGGEGGSLEDVPISSIRFGGPSVGSKTASTISGQG